MFYVLLDSKFNVYFVCYFFSKVGHEHRIFYVSHSYLQFYVQYTIVNHYKGIAFIISFNITALIQNRLLHLKEFKLFILFIVV